MRKHVSRRAEGQARSGRNRPRTHCAFFDRLRVVLAALSTALLAGAAATSPSSPGGGASDPSDPAQAAVTRLRAAPRRPLPVVVRSPTGAAGRVRLREVRAAFDDVIDAWTGLEPVTVPDDAVRGCAARVACIIRQVRPDRDPDRDREREPERDRQRDRDDLEAEGRELPPDAAPTARLATTAETAPRFVLVLTHVAIPQRPDRIVALLIDTERALARLRVEGPSDDEAERAEEAVLRDAVVAEAELEAARDAEDVRSFARRFFRSRVGPLLGAAWRPFGALRLHPVPIGSEIVVDGAAIGIAASSEVWIRDLPAGPRELQVRHPGHAPLTLSVHSRPGETADLEIALRPAGRGPAPRWIVAGAGVATALAGAAVLSAAALGSTDATGFCFEGPGCSPARRFDGSAGPPQPGIGPATSDGVPLVPLGLGLVATGATWTVGAALIERRKIPWASLLTGVVLGGAAFGISAAAAD